METINWCLNFVKTHSCLLCNESKMCNKEYRPLVEEITKLIKENNLLKVEKELLEVEAKVAKVKYTNSLR